MTTLSLLLARTAGRPLTPRGKGKHMKRPRGTRSDVTLRQLQYRPRRARGNAEVVIDLLSTAATKSEASPDQLKFARPESGTSVFVLFADGLAAVVDLASFGIDTSSLKLSTARVGPWGSAVEIEDASGEVVDIDSSVFRSYADPQYAAELEAVIADYHARGGSLPPRQ